MPTYNEIQSADPVLSNIVITHENQDTVGEQLAPTIPVEDREGKFPKWGLDAFKLEEDTLRAPRTKANAVDFGYTWLPFDMEEHALDFEYEEKERQKYMRLGERAGAAELFNLERDGVKSTEDRLQLRREKRTGDRLRSNEIPGEVLSGTSMWDNAAADIPAMARAARNAIRAATGKIMNTVLLPFDVDDVVLWHQSMKDFIGTANAQFVDIDLIRRIFRVQNVITAAMVYNQGTEAVPDFMDVWGKDVIFAYVAPGSPNPAVPGDTAQRVRSRREMSLAYNFRYGRTNNEAATPAPIQGSDQSLPVTAWYDQNTETHIRRVKYEEKVHVVAPGCGYVYRGAIA